MNKLSGIFSTFTLLFTGSLLSSATHEITHSDHLGSPDAFVLAFDMHHTLVKPNVKNMIGVALKTGGLKMAKLFALLPFDSIRYLATGTGSQAKLIHELYKLGFSSTGEAYRNLINQYDPELWKTAEKMATSMTALAGIQELLQELKSLGYTLRVATNGSTWELNGIRQKMPQIFKHFEKDAQTVDNTPVTPKKPDVAYFTDYLKKFDIGKKVIFIDDKQENVDASIKTGMIGIVFTGAQNLREDLIKLGIPLKPNLKK